METTEIESSITIAIDAIARWDVFRRLQELAIPCECTCGEPLKVSVSTAAAAIQVWSVVKQSTSPREFSIDHLKRCWKQQVAKS